MPKIEDENLVALPICIEIYLGIMVNNNMKKLHLKKKHFYHLGYPVP